MKIVINECYGAFGLSQKAIERYAELKGFKLITVDKGYFSLHYSDIVSDENLVSDYNIPRNDPDLVQAVEELGRAAAGGDAALKIVEIPDDISWEIGAYDGNEWVAETHRTWR